jgi:glycosyltransferase involved in cell wall biosynthesis
MPRVSVFMPCYNASANLDKAIESMLSQSLIDRDAVIVWGLG